MSHSYWLDLFTVETWNEFLEAGATVSGFRESRWKSVSKIKPGDFLVCYLTKISRWIGLLEVTSKPYKDKTPIWSVDTFPCRVQVKPLILLKPETAIPVKDLSENLSYFQNMIKPNQWTGHFRGSPVVEKHEDAKAIIEAIKEANKNPIVRPFDENKLSNSPKTYSLKNIEVTIPGKEDDNNHNTQDNDAITHEEIQWLLLKLGQDLGLELWVAKNDKNKIYNGQRFSEFKRIKNSLPVQFDAATNRTIELIDVLWLKGNAIVAAFEVEHTTSIYSGLLRMSDLITMQPNINIKLYIVAPDNRRDKVFEEINRPTFSTQKTPLNENCQFIPYSSLKMKMDDAAQAGLMKYLKPEFIDEISEPCITEL